MADTTDNTQKPNNNKEELKRLELTANVIIIPKPRFYKILVGVFVFILLLWNQALILNTVRGVSDNYCQIQRNQALELPTPPTPKPTIVVPETPSINPTDLASIRDLRRFYLAANEADGKIVLRTGGTVSWRYNNPGKMLNSDFTKSMGSIGSDGTTAIFPSYEAGRKAMSAYLFTSASNYYDKKISELFPEATLRLILSKSGLDRDLVLKDLTLDQQNKLMDAIQDTQGYIEGKVTVFDDETDFKKRGW